MFMHPDTSKIQWIALALVGVMLAPVAAAEGLGMPIGVPAPERIVNGYDWDLRTHATHLLVDAMPYASTIPLDDITTEFLDLEILNLSSIRSYELTLGTRTIPVHSNSQGVGIAWNVPAEPGIGVLRDELGGQVALLVFEGEPALLEPTPLGGCPWYNPRCKQKYEPPRPTRTETLTSAMAVEQAAYSFTRDASVTVERCWSHGVTIGAVATAGTAAAYGSAGGEYGYTGTECIEFTSTGTPVLFRRGIEFRKDVYEDDSYKIYAVGWSKLWELVPMEGRFDPPGNAQTIRIGDTGGNVSVIRKEAHAGAVYYEAGVRAFGNGVGVTFVATAEVETIIRIQLTPGIAGSVREYKVAFVNGDDVRHGIIGMVW